MVLPACLSSSRELYSPDVFLVLATCGVNLSSCEQDEDGLESPGAQMTLDLHFSPNLSTPLESAEFLPD